MTIRRIRLALLALSIVVGLALAGYALTQVAMQSSDTGQFLDAGQSLEAVVDRADVVVVAEGLHRENKVNDDSTVRELWSFDVLEVTYQAKTTLSAFTMAEDLELVHRPNADTSPPVVTTGPLSAHQTVAYGGGDVRVPGIAAADTIGPEGRYVVMLRYVDRRLWH